MSSDIHSPSYMAHFFDGETPSDRRTREVRQLNRGVCPRCSRPLKLVSIDRAEAVLRCSCGAPDHVAPVGSRPYRNFARLLATSIE
jgi:hypothetical protein